MTKDISLNVEVMPPKHPGLAAALAALQAELPTLGKGNTATVRGDKGSYTYRYADLADVSKAIMPLLAKQGLSFSAKPTLDEHGRFGLVYTLRHTSGESDSGVYPLPSGKPQEMGSAITYARRYALCAVTGIAPDQDDDGHAANERWEQDREQDQQLNADGFSDEIRLAKSGDDLTTTSKQIRRSLSSGGITKAAYDRLVQEGAARRAEIDQAEKAPAEAVQP